MFVQNIATSMKTTFQELLLVLNCIHSKKEKYGVNSVSACVHFGATVLQGPDIQFRYYCPHKGWPNGYYLKEKERPTIVRTKVWIAVGFVPRLQDQGWFQMAATMCSLMVVPTSESKSGNFMSQNITLEQRCSISLTMLLDHITWETIQRSVR